MIAAKQWPADKPMPDPEQWLLRDAARWHAQGDELRADQARPADELEAYNAVPGVPGIERQVPGRGTPSSMAVPKIQGGRSCACFVRGACRMAAPSLRRRAQTEITIGKIVGGIGLHLPSYVAMDQGFYKAEGLNARFIELASPPMIRAGMSGNLNFVPIPSGGAQAVLKGGAKLKYVVNQSLSSQYVFVARPEINNARGPARQDDRLRPARRRRLRRGRHRAGALFQDAARQGLQGDVAAGRSRAHRRAAQQGHRRRDGVDRAGDSRRARPA